MLEQSCCSPTGSSGPIPAPARRLTRRHARLGPARRRRPGRTVIGRADASRADRAVLVGSAYRRGRPSSSIATSWNRPAASSTSSPLRRRSTYLRPARHRARRCGPRWRTADEVADPDRFLERHAIERRGRDPAPGAWEATMPAERSIWATPAPEDVAGRIGLGRHRERPDRRLAPAPGSTRHSRPQPWRDLSAEPERGL